MLDCIQLLPQHHLFLLYLLSQSVQLPLSAQHPIYVLPILLLDRLPVPLVLLLSRLDCLQIFLVDILPPHIALYLLVLLSQLLLYMKLFHLLPDY